MARPRARADVETRAFGIRLQTSTIDQLHALRRRLELADPLGRISIGVTLDYAVERALAELDAKEAGRQPMQAA